MFAVKICLLNDSEKIFNSRLTRDRSTNDFYLFALGIFPALPLGESWAPVLDHVRLGVLLALAPAEPALRPQRGDDVHLQQVHLEVLLQRPVHHVLRAPGAAVVINLQPNKRAALKLCRQRRKECSV